MMRSEKIEQLRGGLVVSCQAPAGSPLNEADIMAALALVAERNGAAGVRVNGPEHIAAVRRRVQLPLIGIEKVDSAESEVYITPTLAVAQRIAASGTDIIALDATRRPRPHGERLEDLIRRVREELKLPVMADISTFEEGCYAADCGADLVATTLCGYTDETAHIRPPDFRLVERLAGRLNVPVICEGGVASPEQARRALDGGAFAVVVGGAITGVDQLVRAFVTGLKTG
ncbi:MAG: N-acetylmannosamine-6-phosphate 2-epimerase [Blastocatellia bacterium]